MEKIDITQIMLRQGLQGRIRVREVDRFNKSIDAFKIEVEKRVDKIKKDKKKDNFFMEEPEDEIETILLKPKLRKVRSYKGWWLMKFIFRGWSIN